MLHYAILVHLYYIYQDLINAHDQKTFESIFTNLASVTDTCEEFLFRLFLWTEKKSVKAVLKDGFSSAFTAIEPKIEVGIEKLEKGINYSLSVVGKRDLIKFLVKDGEFGKEMFKFFDNEIRCYRNPIVHSWPIFQIANKYPKPQAIGKTRDWLEVVLIMEDDRKRDDFIKTNYEDMITLAKTAFYTMLQHLNHTWGVILRKI
jgi:hypothetical protein